MNHDMKEILLGVQNGSISIHDALLYLKQQPFEDIGYAKVDLHRKLRQGAQEVIYGEGKTSDQIIGILTSMEKNYPAGSRKSPVDPGSKEHCV